MKVLWPISRDGELRFTYLGERKREGERNLFAFAVFWNAEVPYFGVVCAEPHQDNHTEEILEERSWYSDLQNHVLTIKKRAKSTMYKHCVLLNLFRNEWF